MMPRNGVASGVASSVSTAVSSDHETSPMTPVSIPMVESERSALEARGARVTRVVLDYELRETVLRAWHHANRDRDPDAAKRAVAEAHAVPVIHGRFQFPD